MTSVPCAYLRSEIQAGEWQCATGGLADRDQEKQKCLFAEQAEELLFATHLKGKFPNNQVSAETLVVDRAIVRRAVLKSKTREGMMFIRLPAFVEMMG